MNKIKLIIVLLLFLLLLAGCQLFPQEKNQTSTQPQVNESPQAPPPPPTIGIHFIDVGFGESILVETPTKKALIDCGPDDQKIIDYLRSQNINNLDILIGTHINEQNIGGCDGVLRNFRVVEYFDNGEKSGTMQYIDLMYEIDDEKYRKIKIGDILDVGVAKMFILNPTTLSKDSDLNSIVIRLNYNNINFLFTGDCVEGCERNLIMKGIKDIDVLKVAKYCDKKSTLKYIIRVAKIKVAVIFAGKNDLGYPSQDCIQRMVEEDVAVLRTDQSGTIVLETDGNLVWQRGSSLLWS